jgi:hypothetical protein
VNKVRRVGNGWLGRGITRGRMRARNVGYQGSEKARGYANRGPAPSWARSSQPWGHPKAWR